MQRNSEGNVVDCGCRNHDYAMQTTDKNSGHPDVWIWPCSPLGFLLYFWFKKIIQVWHWNIQEDGAIQ